MRLALAVILAAACTSPPRVTATPSPTPEPAVLSITALLDLSGHRSAIGTAQRNALQLWVDQHQARGGSPVTVRLRIADVADSEARLILELRRAAVEDQADAVIVGAPVQDEEIFGRAVEAAGIAVLLTLPTSGDPVDRPGGRWTFALAPTLARLAARQVDEAVARAALTPALILSDARDRPDAMALALLAELERRRLEPLTRIALPVDGSVPPVVRSSLSVLRGLHCTGTALACAATARAAQSSGASTLLFLSYLTVPADMGEYREAAQRAMWPGSGDLLPFDAPPTTSVGQARAEFLRTYGDRHGPPSTHAATSFDALTLLLHAAERVGADDPERLRARLEETTLPLIASTYSFGARRHAGFDPEDIVYLRWTGSAIGIAPAPTPSPSPTPTPSPGASPTGTRRP